MKLTYRKQITRAMLRAEPGTLFVFGDNMAREGFGGQAKEMRGEPNAVGIPTKWFPGRKPSDYFTDADFHTVCHRIAAAFVRLNSHDGSIIWPADGIGTGLADLQRRAPRIFTYIEAGRRALEEQRRGS